jgi:hypothetical protein
MARLIGSLVVAVAFVPVLLAMWSKAGRLLSSASDADVATGVTLFALSLVLAAGALIWPASELRAALGSVREARDAKRPPSLEAPGSVVPDAEPSRGTVVEAESNS